ncbi:ABC transporter permease [Streptomyces sp. AcE210]|uniref:ABC transporter permease n=1 Tax=Streptomyces sp. AcE210 TaxID=2292703 RepID=UPI000E30152D|nr:ABC transporter permease [Streptomyces sp. AcE210]RFC73558.1 ABC transporter permease [Streptomyces sp. AcE210]
MSAAVLSPSTGLTWTVVRLHRLALWLWIGYVALTGAMLLWLWGPGSSGWQITGKCVAGVMNACSVTGPGAGTYEFLLGLTTSLITIVPAIAAAFAGGTLIGRELERGTAALAWTQSVPPARWLAAKLAVPTAFLVVGTGILVALRRLVASEASGLPDNQWFTQGVYDALGPTAVALPLLGLALGALVAFVSRRVITSICVSLALYGIVVVSLGAVRGHLWPAATVIGNVHQGYRGFTGLLLDEGAVTGSGAHVADPLCRDSADCLARHNVTGFYREFQPASHFWQLQLVETGILLALTALVAAAVFTLLRRRTR